MRRGWIGTGAGLLLVGGPPLATAALRAGCEIGSLVAVVDGRTADQVRGGGCSGTPGPP